MGLQRRVVRSWGRVAVVALAAALGIVAGCSWFEGKKAPLPGERISVLGLDQRLEPDPELAAAAMTLPPAAVNPDWPEAGGEPSHAMQHPALPETLRRAWTADLGEGSGRYTRVMAPPVVAKGRVYALDGGTQLSALDAASGKRIWQVDLKPQDESEGGNGFGGGVAFWNDRLYAATGYGQVLALDPADGKIIWRQAVGAPVHSPPTVAEGRIFAITVENEMAVLSVEDGRRLWGHNGIPETAGLLGAASPAVEGEVVVVPYSSGEVFALTVETGRPLWSDTLAETRRADAVSSLADIRGRPVIDRGRVLAVGHSGRMAAIDLRNGNHVWEQEIGSMHSPWVAGDYVYVLSNAGELLCLTRAEGKVRWLHRMPRWEDEKAKSDPIDWAGPVLGGDQLIVLSSTGERVSLAPATGEPLGREGIGAAAFLGPVIADNTLYILTDDATLAAYR
jgi:outer membrane protein assembly factor BamB